MAIDNMPQGRHNIQKQTLRKENAMRFALAQCVRCQRVAQEGVTI